MESVQRILIVDDEEAILFSYGELLRSPQVEVDGCRSLDTAMILLESTRYDAVLTDIRLSHSESDEGLQILRYLRSRQPDTPVIVMTAYGSDAVKEQVLQSGASGYFDKPVAIVQLIATLQQLGIAVQPC